MIDGWSALMLAAVVDTSKDNVIKLFISYGTDINMHNRVN